MTDVAQAKAELAAALKHAADEAAYLETAARALEGAVGEAAAVHQRITNALTALGDAPPVELPEATLHDAADAAPGEEMEFRLTLEKAGAEEVVAEIMASIDGTPRDLVTVTIPSGQLGAAAAVLIPIGTPDGVDVTATITKITGATVARYTATGEVEAEPPSTGEPIYTGIDVKTVQSIETAQQAVTMIAVVRCKAAATTHEKIAGRDAADHALGGWCVERTNKGALQCWLGGVNGEAKFLAAGAMPIGQAVVVGFRLAFDGTAGVVLGSQTMTVEGVPTFTGPISVGDGWWKHQRRDPWQGDLLSVLVWDHALPVEDYAQQIALAQAVADKANEGPPPNGNGGNGGPPPTGLEPVDQRLHQVTLAPTDITHQWLGAGTGLNSMDNARAIYQRVAQHKARLDRIGMHVLRIFSPQDSASCLAAYRPYFDLFKPKVVAASGFVYRSSGAARSNIRALAEGVRRCRDGGLRIDIVTAQNEPDGNPGNKPRDGSIADHQQQLRDDLDSLGLQHVIVATLEWRHPPNGGIPEFDALKAAGRIGKGKAVELGCGHVYDKTQGLALADRLRSAGLTWSSWETGNNGSGCSSVARELSAANLNSAFAVMHYIMVTTGTPNSEQLGQAFIDYNGNDRPWAGHWEVAFGKALVPDSIIYRFSSDDRPPGLPAAMAQWMERNAATSGGRNPRLAAVVARRPDGKTAIVLTNTTHDSDAFSPYTTGHYGRCDQQVTLRLPWLTGKDGAFQVWRASPGGAIGAPQTAGMSDGYVRCKVYGGETVGLVGG